MSHAKKLRELVEAQQHHAKCKDAADNGKPHWEDQANDFNLRTAFRRVGRTACGANPTIELAEQIIEAAMGHAAGLEGALPGELSQEEAALVRLRKQWEPS